MEESHIPYFMRVGNKGKGKRPTPSSRNIFLVHIINNVCALVKTIIFSSFTCLHMKTNFFVDSKGIPFSADPDCQVQVVLDKTDFSDMSHSTLEKVSVSAFLQIIADQQRTIMSLQEDIAVLTAINQSQQQMLRYRRFSLGCG